MPSGSSAIKIDRPTFGGCSRLLLQYKAVGFALKAYERRCWPFGVGRSSRPAEREFRLALAYIPVEVLESFLEDLLDLDLGDERLFIEQPGIQLSFANLAVISLGFCVLGAIIAITAESSPLLSTLLGCALALFVFAFSLSRHQATRRMRFANLLSQEINGRRGNNRSDKIVQFNNFSSLTPVH